MRETGRLGEWTESAVRVRYAETGAMGIAHHAEYLAWYEVGRTEWIRATPHEGDARGTGIPLQAHATARQALRGWRGDSRLAALLNLPA